MNISEFNELKLMSEFDHEWDISYLIQKFLNRSIIKLKKEISIVAKFWSGFGDQDYLFKLNCTSESQWTSSWKIGLEVFFHVHVTCNGDRKVKLIKNWNALMEADGTYCPEGCWDDYVNKISDKVIFKVWVEEDPIVIQDTINSFKAEDYSSFQNYIQAVFEHKMNKLVQEELDRN